MRKFYYEADQLQGTIECDFFRVQREYVCFYVVDTSIDEHCIFLIRNPHFVTEVADAAQRLD